MTLLYIVVGVTFSAAVAIAIAASYFVLQAMPFRLRKLLLLQAPASCVTQCRICPADVHYLACRGYIKATTPPASVDEFKGKDV